MGDGKTSTAIRVETLALPRTLVTVLPWDPPPALRVLQSLQFHAKQRSEVKENSVVGEETRKERWQEGMNVRPGDAIQWPQVRSRRTAISIVPFEISFFHSTALLRSPHVASCPNLLYIMPCYPNSMRQKRYKKVKGVSSLAITTTLPVPRAQLNSFQSKPRKTDSTSRLPLNLQLPPQLLTSPLKPRNNIIALALTPPLPHPLLPRPSIQLESRIFRPFPLPP